MSLDQKFDELEKNLDRLRERFVAPHVQQLQGDAHELDIKSYCILSHALFEQFIEDVCSAVAKNSMDRWNAQPREVTRPLVALINFYGQKCSTEITPTSKAHRCADVVRLSVDEAYRIYGNYIRQDNHGITEKHLRALLWPVGIEVPSDVRFVGSLEQLTKNRGFHAHGYDIKKIIAPTEALNWVNDCKELSKEIKEDAKKFIGGAVVASSATKKPSLLKRIFG